MDQEDSRRDIAMEFSVSIRNLLEACEHAFGAIKTGREKFDATLECFTIDANADGLVRVFATDNETSVLAWTTGAVKSPGTTMAKAKILRKALKLLPVDDDVTFKLNKTQLLITCGKISFDLQKVSPLHDNAIPNLSTLETKQIGRDLFRKLIDRTLYACSSEESRPSMNGIRFEGTGEPLLVKSQLHPSASAD